MKTTNCDCNFEKEANLINNLEGFERHLSIIIIGLFMRPFFNFLFLIGGVLIHKHSRL